MSDTFGTNPDDTTAATPPTDDVARSETTAGGSTPVQTSATTPAPTPQVPAGWQILGAGTAPGQAGQTPAAPPRAENQYPPYNGPSQPPAAAWGAARSQPYPSNSAEHPLGAGFGVPPVGYGQTQPTLPLGAAAMPGSPATARKSTAGGVIGLIVAAALVGGAAGLGGAYAGVNMWGTSTNVSASAPAALTVNNPDSVTETTVIAAKVLPSVVTISAASGNSGGTGSGVILSQDGYVATNTHVVTLDGAARDAAIRVTTSDGHVYDATVVGTDPIYDLAVIKLKDASGLTPIAFGDSAKLNVGDQTIAVGAPLGLSNTVTTGIVSALNRSIQIASSAAPESSDTQDGNGQQGEGNGQDSPFFFNMPGQPDTPQQATSSISIAVIQTDASINPGNSGGALVDNEGKLIGINVAIATAGGTSTGQSGSIGVGFSIPSDIVKRVTSEIIDNGSATHGLLGATVRPAASVSGSTTTGAYIEEISGGGAAAAGGLQNGDVVTEFNGTPITDSIDLTAQVRAAAAGSTATVTFLRDGKSRSVDVTLGTLGG